MKNIEISKINDIHVKQDLICSGLNLLDVCTTINNYKDSNTLLIISDNIEASKNLTTMYALYRELKKDYTIEPMSDSNDKILIGLFSNLEDCNAYRDNEKQADIFSSNYIYSRRLIEDINPISKLKPYYDNYYKCILKTDSTKISYTLCTYEIPDKKFDIHKNDNNTYTITIYIKPDINSTKEDLIKKTEKMITSCLLNLAIGDVK